jgi:hypothetical protein
MLLLAFTERITLRRREENVKVGANENVGKAGRLND